MYIFLTRVPYWHRVLLQLVLVLILVAPFECLASLMVYLAINLRNVSSLNLVFKLFNTYKNNTDIYSK